MSTQVPAVNLGSTPTIASVSAQVTALAAQVATIQAQVAMLTVSDATQAGQIVTLQAGLAAAQETLDRIHALSRDTQAIAQNAEIAAARG